MDPRLREDDCHEDEVEDEVEKKLIMYTATFISAIDKLGEWGISIWGKLYGMISLFANTVEDIFQAGRRGIASNTRQIVSQILFTGVEAFWLVGAIGLLCGVTIVIQAMTNMPKFGVGEYFGKILVMVIINELGPFFTSIVVAGRSGSALATYIATMRVNKEVSALEVMGIDPNHFLVLPAFAGMILSMVALSFYFDIIGILGGLAVAMIATDINLPFSVMAGKVLSALSLVDIISSTLKSVLFGAIVAIISCYHGLSAHNPRDIPRSARRSVVGSIIVTLILNVLATILIWQMKSFLKM